MKVKINEIDPLVTFIPKKLVIDLETSEDYELVKDLVNHLYIYPMDKWSSQYKINNLNNITYDFIMMLHNLIK